jgi:hemin uptake protein HemP
MLGGGPGWLSGCAAMARFLGTGVLGGCIASLVACLPLKMRRSDVGDVSLAEIRKGEYVSQLNCCELFASLERLKVEASRQAGRTDMQDVPMVGSSQNAAPADAGPRVVSSADLLDGSREIIIRHVGEDYRLRLTRAGKLILNK